MCYSKWSPPRERPHPLVMQWFSDLSPEVSLGNRVGIGAHVTEAGCDTHSSRAIQLKKSVLNVGL